MPAEFRREALTQQQNCHPDRSSVGAQCTSTPHFFPEDLGQIGTANRRFFAASGLNNWDAALLKDTAIKEGMNLEFRAEAFNLFNHAPFGQPDGNVNDNTFDIINTANSPRIMQVSLKLLF
jgi:hypothetical protein